MGVDALKHPRVLERLGGDGGGGGARGGVLVLTNGDWSERGRGLDGDVASVDAGRMRLVLFLRLARRESSADRLEALVCVASERVGGMRYGHRYADMITPDRRF